LPADLLVCSSSGQTPVPNNKKKSKITFIKALLESAGDGWAKVKHEEIKLRSQDCAFPETIH
jgi:hypothetical protein